MAIQKISILLLILTLLMGSAAFGDSQQCNVTSTTEISVDGKVQTTPLGENVYIVDGRAYVTLKFFSVALNKDAGWHRGRMVAFLGATPDWTVVDQEPEANADPLPIRYYFEGIKTEVPQGQQIFVENNTPYVPIRFLAETLGKEVSWTQENGKGFIAIRTAD